MKWGQLRWGFFAAALALAGCSGDAETGRGDAAAAPPGPVGNLLLICVDTVRADVFYGLGEARTDALTRWRDRALVYTNASTSSPWTVPSIASALTGLWPASHGAGRFAGVIAEMSSQIPAAAHPDVAFLTETAANAGMHTRMISASAWTYKRAMSMGLLRGFGKIEEFETGWQPMLAALERAWPAREKDARGFYFLHLMEAHEWHTKEEPELDARLDEYGADERALLARFTAPGACADPDSLLCKRNLVYVAAVRELRTAIAATLDMLEARGALDDTAVILFSDHGEEFGDHMSGARRPQRLEGFADSYPGDYGHGHVVYQELLHVPLMAWHPAHAGAVIDQPFSLVDIAPSAGRWLGLDFAPGKRQGFFLDDGLAPPPALAERVLYASGIAYGEQQVSVRQGDNKSIWYVAADAHDYFDLAQDPGERQPRQAPQWALLLDGHLLDYIASTPQRPVEPGVLTDEQIRRLQSIGYLQGVEVGEDADAQ